MAAASAPTLQAFGDGVIVWEYEADIPGLYSPYTDNVSNFIEKKYQNKEKIVRLGQIDSKLQPFQIDFNKMEQLSQFGMLVSLFNLVFIVILNGFPYFWLTHYSSWLLIYTPQKKHQKAFRYSHVFKECRHHETVKG